MKIRTNQLFRHDVKTYKANQTYTVDDELGTYFIDNGWASDAAAGSTDLQVHDSALGQNAQVN